MRYTTIFLAIFVIFLVGCSTPQAPQDTQPEPSTQPIIEDTSVEQQEPEDEPGQDIPEPAEPPIETSIPDDVEELLDKLSAIESLQFNYHEKKGLVERHMDVWTKGSKTKLLKDLEGDYGVLEKGKEHDTVYLDSDKDAAKGYCEDHKICEDKTGVIDLDYEEEDIMTPFEWAEEIETAEVLNEETYNNRNALKVDTNIGTVWIDTYYGYIMKVSQGDNTYRYEEVSKNSVSDSELEPAS